MSKGTAGRERQTPGAAASGIAKRGWAVRDVIRRITGRKQAEEALRASEERLRSIYEAAIEGIVIHEKGVIVDANVAFEKLLGYPLSELIGMSITELTAEESRALLEEKIRSETQQPYEAVGLRKDGTTFRATCQPRPLSSMRST